MSATVCDTELERSGTLHHEVNFGGSSVNGESIVLGCDSEESHPHYIEALEMNESHLPEPIRCQEVMDVIRLNIELAVKVTVRNKKANFFRAKQNIGNEANIGVLDRTGSGSICYFSDTHDMFTCSHGDVNACELCHIPGCPYLDSLGDPHYVITNRETKLGENELKKAHLAFRVSTNQHVVADDTDARNSSIELFYHSSDRRGVVEARGVCLGGVWEEQDKVHIVCTMDFDRNIMHLLQTMRPKMRRLYAAVPTDIQQLFTKDYAVIVSHPHGQPKKVSVGRKLKSETKSWRNGLWYKETQYDAVTCVGCSGAPVVGPGWEDGGPGYRVHVGFYSYDNNCKKIRISKSFWVVDSDARGGAPVNQCK